MAAKILVGNGRETDKGMNNFSVYEVVSMKMHLISQRPPG